MLCSLLLSSSPSLKSPVKVVMNSAEFDSKIRVQIRHVLCSLCLYKSRGINIATSQYFSSSKNTIRLFLWVCAPKVRGASLHVFPVFLPPLLQNSAWRNVLCSSKNISTSRHVPPSRFLCKSEYINSSFQPLYFLHHNISRYSSNFQKVDSRC
jgi:hypothetical protein